MIKKLTILHEYGAPRHFQALYYLQEKNKIAEIESIEFNIPKQFAKGMVYRDISLVKEGFQNMRKFVRLLRKKRQIIVIGAAPYDLIIPFLRYLKTKSGIIYFTSWPYWSGDQYPKRVFFPNQRKLWHEFIDGVKAVTVSNAAREAISKLRAKAVHIPHSVDTKLFRPGKSKTDNSKLRVLFVGQIARHKGVDLLLDIIKDKLWENVEYWFVGKGPLSGDLTQMASQGYPIKYFGYISSRNGLAEIYREANIFVLPSRGTQIWQEFFGIVLIEAMASGLPIIATDCVGPRELITNGQNGFIIRQNSKSELLSSIEELIKSPKRRKKMGKAGRGIAVEQYDVAIAARKWQSALKQKEGQI